MKSVCIKLNNQKTAEYLLEYLLEQLNNFDIDNVYFSCKKFKIYYNVIVHFKGKNIDSFTQALSQTLSFIIINLYEKNIIDSLIKSEYFYFDTSERIKISNITFEDLYDTDEAIYSPSERFNVLYKTIYKYLTSSHSLLLKGFITFRLKKYFESLLEQIDKSVNKYIVEKEYTEFISLLRMYINSESLLCNVVHLIYYKFNII